jgi:hypothetical protein
VVRVTENVLLAFGAGPAGRVHPSVANWQTTPIPHPSPTPTGTRRTPSPTPTGTRRTPSPTPNVGEGSGQ